MPNSTFPTAIDDLKAMLVGGTWKFVSCQSCDSISARTGRTRGDGVVGLATERGRISFLDSAGGAHHCRGGLGHVRRASRSKPIRLGAGRGFWPTSARHRGDVFRGWRRITVRHGESNDGKRFCYRRRHSLCRLVRSRRVAPACLKRCCRCPIQISQSATRGPDMSTEQNKVVAAEFFVWIRPSPSVQ